ncbi:hypothetical protein NDU88_004774 [Pleurodeles waltl]|uniref:CCHC-type domain-containing protein n=1 Tax=Pleurodeles waltl TaxID=8319 RepID=A0AAV7QCY7_PLEWA|nr:hypothetical protein NDU88_004774 [Pleurodeles waltl]
MATLDELVKAITQFQAVVVSSKELAASLAERVSQLQDKVEKKEQNPTDRELLDLRQGNQDLVSYLANFNRLVAETSWPEEKQAVLFYMGLKEELKYIIAQIDPQPTDCQDLINLLLRLDHRLTERRGTSKKTGKYYLHVHDNRDSRTQKERTPEPIEIGTIRRPLTKEEKDLRRKNGQCLYCGRNGHFAKECPIKPKSKQGPFQKVAANAQVELEN